MRLLLRWLLRDTAARMKVAISLPDPVFKAAEQLARHLNKPRSRLYAEAIVEYVGTHGSTSITEQLNAVYGVESSSLDQQLVTLRLAQQRQTADSHPPPSLPAPA